MHCAVCTLFEGDYHYGVGALVNSLYKSGFRGKVYAGYRGNLPPWAKAVRREGNMTDVLAVKDGLEVVFIKLTTSMHFTNYKPRFMLDLLAGPAREATQLHYLDPDIVLKCNWTMMEAWAQGGIGLSENERHNVGPRHPLRNLWRAWLSENHLQPQREVSAYYNAGYIGVERSGVTFLKTWEKIINLSCQHNGTNAALKSGTSRDNLFCYTDQDALNVTLMLTEDLINAAGPDGMDFAPLGFLLSHAVGPHKPWRGGFLQRALKGEAPRPALKTFFKYRKGPLPILPWFLSFALMLDLFLARGVCRVYSKK
jgi:hypothetical protein